MVDLDDPRLKLVIKEYVEAKDLKAHRVLNIIRLTTPVSVRKLWLDRQQTLDDGLFYVFHNQIRVVALLLNIFHCVR